MPIAYTLRKPSAVRLIAARRASALPRPVRRGAHESRAHREFREISRTPYRQNAALRRRTQAIHRHSPADSQRLTGTRLASHEVTEVTTSLKNAALAVLHVAGVFRLARLLVRRRLLVLTYHHVLPRPDRAPANREVNVLYVDEF